MFAKLDLAALADALGRCPDGAVGATGLAPIAVDGDGQAAKRATNTGRRHLVSTWATEDRLTLGPSNSPPGTGHGERRNQADQGWRG